MVAAVYGSTWIYLADYGGDVFVRTHRKKNDFWSAECKLPLDRDEPVVTVYNAAIRNADAAVGATDASVHMLAQGVTFGRQLACENVQA